MPWISESRITFRRRSGGEKKDDHECSTDAKGFSEEHASVARGSKPALDRGVTALRAQLPRVLVPGRTRSAPGRGAPPMVAKAGAQRAPGAALAEAPGGGRTGYRRGTGIDPAPPRVGAGATHRLATNCGGGLLERTFAPECGANVTRLYPPCRARLPRASMSGRSLAGVRACFSYDRTSRIPARSRASSLARGIGCDVRRSRRHRRCRGP